MKGFLRAVLFFIVVYNVIRIFFSLVGNDDQETYYLAPPSCQEEWYEDSVTYDRIHQREWQIPRVYQSHCMQYVALDRDREAHFQTRANLKAKWTDDNLWGNIYNQLVAQSVGKLDHVADSLEQVGLKNGYTPVQLASLVVSFVQDIPYSFVIPGPCEGFQTDGKPCLGDIPYGIISPYEFLYSLYGDCDTRAVLLFVLLERLGFEPMIVVSDQYAHAMLALSIPAQGEYLTHAGKRYYFWETTATGWGIGMLPPETNNKKYWKIALVHES